MTLKVEQTVRDTEKSEMHDTTIRNDIEEKRAENNVPKTWARAAICARLRASSSASSSPISAPLRVSSMSIYKACTLSSSSSMSDIFTFMKTPAFLCVCVCVCDGVYACVCARVR